MKLPALMLSLFALLLGAWHPHSDVVVKKWYDNGQLAEVREYHNGEKNGTHRGWWPNGARQFECDFSNGESAGTCQVWYDNGQPATLHRFEHGSEAGLQQGWSHAGALQFSYVMRDGRRYGLLGTMTCKTGARAAGEI